MNTLPKNWLVPRCREAIDLLNYYNPDAAFMLDIMYKDTDDGRVKPLYDHIGVLEGDIWPWAVKPPMCELLTIDEFKEKIYHPFVFDFDLP
jgi:hypothetical protein